MGAGTSPGAGVVGAPPAASAMPLGCAAGDGGVDEDDVEPADGGADSGPEE